MPKSPEFPMSHEESKKGPEQERRLFEALMSVFRDRNFDYLDPREQTTPQDIYQEHQRASQADMSASPQSFHVLAYLENEIRKAHPALDQKPWPSPERIKEILKVFKGKPLVDIGAGENEKGYRIAQALEASGYIAIEPFFAKSLLHRLREKIQPDEAAIPFVVVRTDALETMRHLDVNSVNILSSATDSFILRNPDYNLRLGTEVERVLGSQGVFLKYDSVIATPGLETTGVIYAVNFGKIEYSMPTVIFLRKSDKKQKSKTKK